MGRRRVIGFVTIVCCALIVFGGCATGPAEKDQKTAGDHIDAAVLKTHIKSKLVADATVRAMKIGVTVDGNEVTLSGTVASEAEKARVIQIAEDIVGEGNVHSLLEVE